MYVKWELPVESQQQQNNRRLTIHKAQLIVLFSSVYLPSMENVPKTDDVMRKMRKNAFQKK